MSEQWKTLDDEARRPFLERAANDKERYQEEKLRWEGNQAAKAVPKGGKELRKDVEAGRRLADEMLFPLARIRKIMKLDPEVKTVSKEAALLVGKATVRRRDEPEKHSNVGKMLWPSQGRDGDR
jgi:hypothetical protein